VGIVTSGVPLDYLNSYTQKVAAVTQEQIRRAFQQRVKMGSMVMVTVGQSVEQKKNAD